MQSSTGPISCGTSGHHRCSWSRSGGERAGSSTPDILSRTGSACCSAGGRSGHARPAAPVEPDDILPPYGPEEFVTNKDLVARGGRVLAEVDRHKTFVLDCVQGENGGDVDFALEGCDCPDIPPVAPSQITSQRMRRPRSRTPSWPQTYTRPSSAQVRSVRITEAGAEQSDTLLP